MRMKWNGLQLTYLYIKQKTNKGWIIKIKKMNLQDFKLPKEVLKFFKSGLKKEMKDKFPL